jgi:hypothetical protein
VIPKVPLAAVIILAVAAIGPEIVSVGIETDFFWRAHPDQWAVFRDLLCAAGARLRPQHPGIHVTTYFTLSAMVDRYATRFSPFRCASLR